MTNVLDAVLAQYEKNTTNFGEDRMSKEERMKKYFACILGENETQGQRKVRILPTKDGSSPFKEVWYHEIQVDGKWTKLYDPAKNDNERSPLTEVYEELMATGKESDKELAKQYKSRKFYIVKVIDRDKEHEGVKFWRFKDNYKKEGVLDKIIPIWRAKGDITDANKGRDLIIQLSKSKTNAGKPYTTIQTVMHDDPSALSSDNDIMKSWLEDDLEWSDVYTKKPVEYLEAISRGEVPKWNPETQKWVYGDEAIMTMGGNKEFNSSVVDPQEGMDPDEDLPF
jgi:hypothetical protein